MKEYGDEYKNIDSIWEVVKDNKIGRRQEFIWRGKKFLVFVRLDVPTLKVWVFYFKNISNFNLPQSQILFILFIFTYSDSDRSKLKLDFLYLDL